MTKKSQDTGTEDAVADDFATTMPAWMPDGLDEEVEAAADDAPADDAEPTDAIETEGAVEAEVAGADDAEAPEMAAEAGTGAQDEGGAVEAAGDPEPQDLAAQESGEAIVVLPKQARLPEAEDIIERLTAAIDAEDLVIDAREVEDITTPVVTAIISALNTRADKTPPAAVLAPTPAFVDAFSDLGLFQDLMKMEFRQ